MKTTITRGLLFLPLVLSPNGHAQDQGTIPQNATAVFSKFPIKFSGYLKMDAAHDSGRMVDGNYCLYALSEEINEDDEEFNLTGRQSRLTMRITGPSSGKLRIGGLVELDAYGGGAENKNTPLLRHAYLTATWSEYDLEILAGQTWDVISAFYMPTIYYTAGMAVGDIGYRRPQLRVTKEFDLSPKTRLTVQTAFSRTIGKSQDDPPFCKTGSDTGEDTDFPTLQLRFALDTECPLTKRKATFALYGHWGHEEYDLADNGHHRDLLTWSMGAEAALPLYQAFTLRLSFWTGANLDTYLGGIVQGETGGTDPEVTYATGGFAVLTYNDGKTWEFNCGYGVDDPANGDIVTTGAGRSRNAIIFGNGWYRITPDLRAGLELSYWETEYLNARDGTVFRTQFALQFFF